MTNYIVINFKTITMQKISSIILFLSICLVANAQFSKSQLTGTWNGVLNANGAELNIVFHIQEEPSGNLSATLDSPDQGAYGIPMGNVEFDDANLSIEAPSIGAKFKGSYQESSLIPGSWVQGGMEFELIIEKEGESKDESFNAPNSDNGSLEYHTEEVRIQNKEAGIELAGTFAIPHGEGPFPGVILITGSGPQDRDETLLGHKPFRVITDSLCRNGIAVLRYDDRGTNESTGEYGTSTTADFAEDAKAVFEFLNNEQRVSAAGIIGHSEGGLIACMLASEIKEIDFIVLLAAPGINGYDLMLEQTERINREFGLDEEEVNNTLAVNKAIFDIFLKEKDNQKALEVSADKMHELLIAQGTTKENADIAVEQFSRRMTINTIQWLRFFLQHEPTGYLGKITCPVLALNGTKDLQVYHKTNLEIIQKEIEKSGNNHVNVKSLPDLNHLFQHCETGLPTEYATIEEDISAGAVQIILEWILSQNK